MDNLVKLMIGLMIFSNRPAPVVAAVVEQNLQQCRSEAVYGFPIAPKQDTTKLCRKGYAIEYDNVAKIPVWVAYLLTPKEATGCFKRKSDFETDIGLRADARSTPHDYAKSGYDAGHQANVGDMLWDLKTERESFLLSNVAPQLPKFNRGIWRSLEESTRGWVVNRRNPVQVYVGPIYDRERGPTIGRNRVTVPSGFWKVLIDTKTNEVMVFMMKHEGSKQDLSTFITTMPELRKKTRVVLPTPPKPVFVTEMWPRIVKSIGRQKTAICSLKP